jgi:AAA15 family ATPase/GTPase
MNCTIDQIQVQNFRGIRRLDLLVEGRNLIVVGENGAGKSSLVDALEYFFT